MINKKKGVKRSFLYRVILPVLIIIILIYFVRSGSGWVLFFTCLLFIYPIYWISEWLARCPKCDKWGASNKIKTDVLGIDEDKDRYFSETTSHKDFNDKIIKTTKNYKKESWTTHYLDHFECKYCKHKWEAKRSERKSVKTEV